MQTRALPNFSRSALGRISRLATLMFTRATDQSYYPVIAGALACATAFCILTALSACTARAWAQGVDATPPLAQSSAKKPNAGAPATNSGAPKFASKPAWQDLTPAQQVSLKPLAANWNTLGEAPKRKWIAIAASYPSLAPAEQAKLHSRMTEWVSLSQQQRARARLNFVASKQLSTSEKAARWEAYQALSPEEKKKLAISAPPKPAGAAAATKPVPPKKLAAVPVTREALKQMPKISAATHAVNKNTLLPHPQPPVAPASAQKN